MVNEDGIIHGAGVVLVRKDGSVLLQHRENRPDIFWPDHWAHIGGGVEKDEDPELAARRELKEETGYTAETLFPLLEEDYKRSDGEPVRRHMYFAIYDEKQEIKCNEGLEMKFVRLNELQGKKFLPNGENLLHLAVQKAKEKGLI